MNRARHLLVVCAAGVVLVLLVSPVYTREDRFGSTLLVLPEALQPAGLGGLLTRSEPITIPRRLDWFQDLSPLELALLPEGSWIDPPYAISWPWPEGEIDPSEEWRPLSEEELTQRKTQLAAKALVYSAELADSLRASYVGEGLRWTEATFSSYHDALERYRLHLDLSDDQAALQYNLTY